jgi:uncharacterized protein YdhG (YjbR/CyaY superfamily)
MTIWKPGSASTPVTLYLDAAQEPARSRMRTLADIIRAEAPDAVERIAYGLATWHQGENLIHLGGFKRHVGIYPGADAIVAFAADLDAFKTSKGAIQVPHDASLPTDLVRRITRWRLEQAAAKAAQKTVGRHPGGPRSGAANPDIVAHNASPPDQGPRDV